jgi:hypothetical protein
MIILIKVNEESLLVFIYLTKLFKINNYEKSKVHN